VLGVTRKPLDVLDPRLPRGCPVCPCGSGVGLLPLTLAELEAEGGVAAIGVLITQGSDKGVLLPPADLGASVVPRLTASNPGPVVLDMNGPDTHKPNFVVVRDPLTRTLTHLCLCHMCYKPVWCCQLCYVPAYMRKHVVELDE
jgi:hypothetical protein